MENRKMKRGFLSWKVIRLVCVIFLACSLTIIFLADYWLPELPYGFEELRAYSSTRVRFFTENQPLGKLGEMMIAMLPQDLAFTVFDSWFRRKPFPFHFDFVPIVAAAVRMRKYPTAIRFVELLDSVRLSNNLYIMNMLANCLCRSGRTALAFSVLARILKVGLEPSVVTFTTLVNGLCWKVKVAEAAYFVDLMLARGYAANEYTYGVVVKGLCASGNPIMAVDWVINLERRGRGVGNVVVYTTCIDSLCKEGHVDEDLELHELMTSKGIRSNIFNYNSLLHGLGSRGRSEQAKALLKKQIKHGVMPDVIFNNILIQGLSANG